MQECSWGRVACKSVCVFKVQCQCRTAAHVPPPAVHQDDDGKVRRLANGGGQAIRVKHAARPFMGPPSVTLTNSCGEADTWRGRRATAPDAHTCVKASSRRVGATCLLLAARLPARTERRRVRHWMSPGFADAGQTRAWRCGGPAPRRECGAKHLQIQLAGRCDDASSHPGSW
eukprot:366102-Chlamydomonas_euryale.AAC.2